MHLSQDELSRLIKEAKQKITVGGTYRHYKSPDMTYVVKDIVIQEADSQPYVIYQAQYGNNITFSRPVSVWLEEVEFEGKKVARFTKLNGAVLLGQ